MQRFIDRPKKEADKMNPVLLLFAGILLIVIIAVVAVVSAVTSVTAAVVADEESGEEE